MAMYKICVFWACVVSLALVLPSYAQNSPQDYLNAHNTARAAVGVPALSWDNTLAADAQVALGPILDECSVTVDLSSSGLNVKVGDSSLTGVAAVNAWVDEEIHYDYPTNTCIGGYTCSHYTQVVWSSSVNVGCSMAQCLNGLSAVGCKYNPAGNIPGQRPY